MQKQQKKRYFLFPFNGNTKEALEYIDADDLDLAIIDDNVQYAGKFYNGIPIFSRAVLDDISDYSLSVLVGSPTSFANRRDIIAQFPGDRLTSVVSKTAEISRFAKLGKHNLIMSGVKIMPDAKIGNHCIILPNTIVHHDSIIEDYTILGSGVIISGSVVIGENSYIGSKSSIKNGVSVSPNTLVGMGSNVVKNIQSPGNVVIGNPAKILS